MKPPYICKKCGEEKLSLNDIVEDWDNIYCTACASTLGILVQSTSHIPIDQANERSARNDWQTTEGFLCKKCEHFVAIATLPKGTWLWVCPVCHNNTMEYVKEQPKEHIIKDMPSESKPTEVAEIIKENDCKSLPKSLKDTKGSFWAKLFRKGEVEKKEAGNRKDQGYWLSAEIDIPILSKSERWYRSTLPVIVQRAMSTRGVQSMNALNNTLSGKHIEHFNLQDHLRLFGISNVTFWSDKHGAYAAGVLKNVTDAEKKYIKSAKSLIFRFKCFYYPEYPILYFVLLIPVSDKEGATLHSVANFSDGDLQEFALSVEKHHIFNLYLFDEMYQHINSVAIPLSDNICDDLTKMFDSANAYFNQIDKEHVNFSKAGQRFNEQYPDDFCP